MYNSADTNDWLLQQCLRIICCCRGLIAALFVAADSWVLCNKFLSCVPHAKWSYGKTKIDLYVPNTCYILSPTLARNAAQLLRLL